jgi:hypothetical protein
MTGSRFEPWSHLKQQSFVFEPLQLLPQHSGVSRKLSER